MTQSETDLRKELEGRLRFEMLLADLSARLVALSADGVDAAIGDAQRRIVETLGLDRSSLWQFSEQNAELILTHFWGRPGMQRFPPRLNAAEFFPWGHERPLKGEIVRCSTLNELPPEAARDVETSGKFGPKSNVTFPLSAGGQAFGALAFGTLRDEGHWSNDLVGRLRLVAELIANTLARKRSEEGLRRALDEVRRLKGQLQRESLYLHEEVQALHGPDVRHLQSLSRRIAHFHTPDALREQFERDGDAAGEGLAQAPQRPPQASPAPNRGKCRHRAGPSRAARPIRSAGEPPDISRFR
jgi:GAF domain-containing protein